MEEREMGEKLRIYVGGLGPNVEEDDLKRTFGSPQLGHVELVEIIRTKGRSFAYMEFVPASDKALARLFSSYNGCMWKGGRLKLEKAREHYLFRLRRGWTEEAELEAKSASQDLVPDESMVTLQKPMQEQDIAKMQLQIFFPKLRKIKPVPFKGTGKHKYSFQRVEVPPLPINFCDCEEHYIPPDLAKKVSSSSTETDVLGINEEELNIMKSVLNKLLEKDNRSDTVPDQAQFTEEVKDFSTSVDNKQTVDSEEDEVSDDDGLVINMVAQPGRRVNPFEDWGLKTTAANQDSLSGGLESSIDIHKLHGSEKRKILPDKRKASSHENEDVAVPPESKVKKGKYMDNSNALGAQSTSANSGSATSQKSAWRALAREKKPTAFHISDILTEPNHELEAKPGPDPPAAPYSGEKHSQNAQSNIKDDKLEQLSDDQPNESDDDSEKLSDDQPNESDDESEEPSDDQPNESGDESEELSDDQPNKSDDESEALSDDQPNKSDDESEALSDDQPNKSDDESEALSDDQPNKSDDESEELSDDQPNKSDDESEELSDDQLNKSDDELEKLSDDQPNKSDDKLEKLSDDQPNKSSASEDKPARGALWVQKSPWLQLVGDANNSSFSIGQILPGVAFEKQEPPQPESINFSVSRDGNQDPYKNKKFPVGGTRKVQGRANSYTSHRNSDVIKGKDRADIDGRHSSPDAEQRVEQKEVMHDSVPRWPTNNRAPVKGIVISETCPFMKSAASMKEWVKTKAALNGTLKKKRKAKDEDQD